MIKNKSGFSLVEIMVGIALLGLVAFFSSNLLNMGKKLEKQSLLELDKNAEFRSFLSYMNSRNVDWRSYLPQESFYLNNGKLSNVKWKLGDDSNFTKKEEIAIDVDGTNKTFFRTAHSLENFVQGSKYKRVIFSRCVSKIDDAYSMTGESAYLLPFAPVAKVISKDQTRIYCCKRDNLNCTTNQVVNKDSEYQVKTFIYSSSNMIVFPKKSDEFIAALGFYLYFDKDKNPQNYLTTVISAVDRCSNVKVKNSNSKKCSNSYLIKTNLIKGTALGVQDRGYIQVQ